MAYHQATTKDGVEVVIEQKKGRCFIKGYQDTEVLDIHAVYYNLETLKDKIRCSTYHKG